MTVTVRASLGEVWKPIPWLDGYQVSSHGCVRSLDRYVTVKPGVQRFVKGRLLKLGHRPNGYVFFSTTGKSNHLSRIVLRVFVREPIDREEARHLDGDKDNNSLDNLAWGSPSENAQDKRRHGTYGEGERHSMAKLSDEQVELIRADSRTQQQIASDFGVSRSHVGALKRGTFRVARCQQ